MFTNFPSEKHNNTFDDGVIFQPSIYTYAFSIKFILEQLSNNAENLFLSAPNYTINNGKYSAESA